MKKHLIINADDFGWDKDATEGILTLARRGKITSTSIMANFVDYKSVASLLLNNNISIGFHINLLSGEPVSPLPQVQTLIGEDGNFLSLPKLLIRAAIGGVDKEELENEILAQLNFLIAMNVPISHADSHKHVLQCPFIGPMITEILKDTEIKKTRNCKVTDWHNKKMAIVRAFSMLTASNLNTFIKPQALISTFSEKAEANMSIFKEAIDQAFNKYSIVEFMTHPAINNREGSYLNRKAEYEFWLNENWLSYLVENDIDLISYNQLKA
ncbi:MAG: ChbG/HpnK family deacetylase [Bacteroidota bacterium]|nr:ChbG/HpnK family deacetylase [Bacteroidota bacterium]